MAHHQGRAKYEVAFGGRKNAPQWVARAFSPFMELLFIVFLAFLFIPDQILKAAGRKGMVSVKNEILRTGYGELYCEVERVIRIDKGAFSRRG